MKNMDDWELKNTIASALTITYSIIEDAYGKTPDSEQEAKDRIEAFKIILEKTIEELLKHAT
jgi:hypothetical protein